MMIIHYIYLLWKKILENFRKNKHLRYFPGGPVVRTLRFHC